MFCLRKNNGISKFAAHYKNRGKEKTITERDTMYNIFYQVLIANYLEKK